MAGKTRQKSGSAQAVHKDTNAPSIWSAKRKGGLGSLAPISGDAPKGDSRTPFEKDYDRLLFSTPVRRLADKTQVFPLERNDSVRTRLTHSHEVANLARSLGTRLLRINSSIFGEEENCNQAPVILATVGLAHDLGNPPFGHQGETAIKDWFSEHEFLFAAMGRERGKKDPRFVAVPTEQQGDFLQFEGNAQSLRLLCRLQNTIGDAGLDLTAGTLAALMKYPVSSAEVSQKSVSSKKHGYFVSEADFVGWIRSTTGLKAGQRHPLTWLMEASDDIAYSVLDIEDAMKKGLVSPEDLLAHLRHKFPKEQLGNLLTSLTTLFKKADNEKFSLSRSREIKIGYLRTLLIDKLMASVVEGYVHDHASILDYSRSKALLECESPESDLCACLKDFAKSYAYQSQNVLELEYSGSIVLKSLMTDMWEAISSRKDFAKLNSRRTTPKASFVYSLISDSYRWHFEENLHDSPVSIRYRELQLLSDMISGMTDSFAVDLYKRIRRAGN